MRFSTIAVAMTCAACGGTQTMGTLVDDRRTWTERMQDAEYHDQFAADHEHQAAYVEGALGEDRYDCGDVVLHEQSTSGTEPVSDWTPCYDISGTAAKRHRDAAEQHRDAARRDRASASALVQPRTP